MAEAFAEALGAPPATVSAILLPDLPWRGGYQSAAGGLDTLGGARLGLEVSGADWFLTGKVSAKEEVWLFLASKKGLEAARFTSTALALAWVSRKLGIKPGNFQPNLDHEEALQRLAEGSLDQATGDTSLHQAALTLQASGTASPRLAPLLPSDLVAFWVGLRQSQSLPPAYLALLDQDADPKNTLQAAKKLLAGKIYERVSALLLLRKLANDGLDTQGLSWQETARELTTLAPELPLAWEELGYAAFDNHDPALAKQVLERAVSLVPASARYWTNLGWANYLLGDKANAIRASLRALSLEDTSTAAYNLGLARALYGDLIGARRAYTYALKIDQEEEFEAAIQDLYDSQDPRMNYWIGFLAERTGNIQQAHRAYQAFLAAFPNQTLSRTAQKALSKPVKTNAAIGTLLLRPDGLEARPFRAGETIFPVVLLSGEPFLERAVLRVSLVDTQGTVVASGEKKIQLATYSTGLEELGPAVVAPKPGAYRLEVRYGSATASTELQIGAPSLARGLYAVGLEIRGLAHNLLLSESEMLGPQGDKLLVERIQGELQVSAPEAMRHPNLQNPLPSGPFKGKSMASLLQEASPQLVRQFLEAALEQPDLIGDTDVVNAFIAWVLGQK